MGCATALPRGENKPLLWFGLWHVEAFSSFFPFFALAFLAARDGVPGAEETAFEGGLPFTDVGDSIELALTDRGCRGDKGAR